MTKVVYILADNRSGSTLLDQLLGAHEEVVSLGEVHHLPAYVHEDRALYNPSHELVCSCGEQVRNCCFWRSVERRLGRPLASLELSLRYFDAAESLPHRRLSLKRLPRRWLTQYPRAYLRSSIQRLFGGPTIASESFDLFDAVGAETGAKYLVDSSKLPFRFRSLHDHRPKAVYAVTMVRDYRGTVFSKSKRGVDIESAARGWATRMRQVREMTADIPRDRLHHVKYEELCENPDRVLRALCTFLELEFSDSLLYRPTTDIHHLGGSPSKFDSSRRNIALDASYLEAFSSEQLAMMRRIVAEAAEEWGYG